MLRRHARKVGVFVVGWLVVIAGLVMLITPGPGWVAIFLGLSLLATEFEWAARLKTRLQTWLANRVESIQAKRAARHRRRRGPVDEAIEDIIEDVEDAARGDVVAEKPASGTERNRSIAS